MNNTQPTDGGRQLISEALANPAAFNKHAELLAQFFHGLPIEALSELLQSSNGNTILAGLFIVGELGEKASPVLDDVIALTHHQVARIRCSAYAALTCCVPKERPEMYANFVRGLQDIDPGCRQYVMSLMMRASDRLLRAALDALKEGTPDAELREGLSTLLSDAAQDSSHVKSWFSSGRPFTRKIGAVAAGRLAGHDASLLEAAATSDDPDVQRSAALQIKFESLRKKWTQQPRDRQP
jgi:hypothetical protein